MTEQITAKQFHAAEGVEDWRALYHVVSTHYRTESLVDAAAFAVEVAKLGEAAGDRLKIDLRAGGVTVSMPRDIEMARHIAAAAKHRGLPADPAAVQLVNLVIDALVSADVLPFWRALLGYRDLGADYLYDPQGRWPSLEFQRMDTPRPQHNRIHLDVAVPHEQAEIRIAAAVAAGGRIVTDAYAPKWWVLADPEGNEACVATWVGRE